MQYSWIMDESWKDIDGTGMTHERCMRKVNV
jgi:hypothetical protein